MAKRDPTEEAIAELAEAARDPGAASSLTLLRKALKGRSAHVVAKAAQIAGDAELEALVPDLAAAFQRFLLDPVKKDPGCAAKTSIADALYRIGAFEREVYRVGIRHVQREPVWGGTVDTAVGLRGSCALALVRTRDPDCLTAIAELLADPEAQARRMAAQALAYGEDPAAVPLLRLKALVGDEEADVLGECLLALLAISPAESLPFAARFLERGEEGVAEAAALALGGSRLAEALPLLREWWERTCNPTLRRAALLAIAMLKRAAAIEWLLEVLGGSPLRDARDALGALAIYRHDDKLRERVGEVVGRRDEAALDPHFRDVFGTR